MSQPDSSNLEARLARVESVVPYLVGGGSFAPQQFSTIDAAGIIDGKLNLAVSSGINVKGIMSPNIVDGQFSVAKPSDSSATIYWDGTNSSRVIIIRRPDSQGQGLNGTSTTVPGSNITITGLTHDLTYQILPYWVPFNSCGIGFAPGTVGTPKIAFLSTDSDTTFAQGRAIQSLMGREPLGNVSWMQPAAGGSSGGGTPITPPSRQPGTCVRLGTHIEPLGSPRPSEIATENHLQDKWVHLEADNLVLECTPDHPLYHDDKGKMEAQYFIEGDSILTRYGVRTITKAYSFVHACTKVEVKMKFGHQFYANGFLSHNVKNALDQT